ncbi:uncharacterized protein LOC117123061 [Anneissia japonica]|uniref:uncharacterized protein LOC117123061 n=1 Tax=Anneissia japonica TaxID=1529436 RepID=UPI001425852D|nr:uncharacterized protein LOC117123061 [Anneissia japonica]
MNPPSWLLPVYMLLLPLLVPYTFSYEILNIEDYCDEESYVKLTQHDGMIKFTAPAKTLVPANGIGSCDITFKAPTGMQIYLQFDTLYALAGDLKECDSTWVSLIGGKVPDFSNLLTPREGLCGNYTSQVPGPYTTSGNYLRIILRRTVRKDFGPLKLRILFSLFWDTKSQIANRPSCYVCDNGTKCIDYCLRCNERKNCQDMSDEDLSLCDTLRGNNPLDSVTTSQIVAIVFSIGVTLIVLAALLAFNTNVFRLPNRCRNSPDEMSPMTTTSSIGRRLAIRSCSSNEGGFCFGIQRPLYVSNV